MHAWSEQWFKSWLFDNAPGKAADDGPLTRETQKEFLAPDFGLVHYDYFGREAAGGKISFCLPLSLCLSNNKNLLRKV